MKTSRQIEELNMADARRELTRLPEKLTAHPGTVTVTRRGKPVLAIMTWEDFEAISETLEILSEEGAVDQLRRSIQEAQRGETVPWDVAKAELESARPNSLR